MWKGQLTTIFGLMLAIGTAVVGGLATGIIPPDFLPQWVKGVFALMMVIGGAGVGYFGKDYNITGGTIRNPDGEDRTLSKLVLLLILPCILLAGCNGVCWMSPQYKATITRESEVINQLNVRCQTGDPNACRQGLNEAAGAFEDILNASSGL